jgi:hypothetical protein
MKWLRVVFNYTLVLSALCIALGFVLGVIYRILDVEHQWGTVDATRLIGVVSTFAVTLAVFAALARKHAAHYFTAGSAIVVLSATLTTIMAYFNAPPDARANVNWPLALLVPLFFDATALVAVGLFRRRLSSSYTSLEQTRDR